MRPVNRAPDIAVRVSAEAVDAAAELAAFETPPRVGAVVSFTGRVRGDDGVDTLELEHFPGRTENAMHGYAQNVAARFGLEAVRVVHRIGAVALGETIVFVAAAAAHRRAAFEGAGALMDLLKTEAPFWKKERGPALDRWVEPKADDKDRAAALLKAPAEAAE